MLKVRELGGVFVTAADPSTDGFESAAQSETTACAQCLSCLGS